MSHIGYDEYPAQLDGLGTRALVIFNYDESRPLPATVVRDDAEDPFLTILRLDDGRVVMGSECQWTCMQPADMARYPDPGIPTYAKS